jgi:hypothetical protein
MKPLRGSDAYRPHKEAEVAIAAIFEYPAPPDGSVWQQRRDSYDHMDRELGGGQPAKTASDMADGLLVHFVGEAQDGRGVIVNVFESQEAMDRLMERMTQIRRWSNRKHQGSESRS